LQSCGANCSLHCHNAVAAASVRGGYTATATACHTHSQHIYNVVHTLLKNAAASKLSTEPCTDTGAVYSTHPVEFAGRFGRGSKQQAPAIARGQMLMARLPLLHAGLRELIRVIISSALLISALRGQAPEGLVIRAFLESCHHPRISGVWLCSHRFGI
jgi:hypothetical protein